MSNFRRQMQGSSLVESVVLLAVLVPVIFGVVMIGKLIDLQQTSVQAGRYAAWEATVYPANGPHSVQPVAVNERFFSDASAALSSNPTAPPSNTLWGAEAGKDDRSWSGRTAIAIDEGAPKASVFERGIGPTSGAMSVGNAAADSGEVLDGFKGNSWGLTTNGLVRAGVSVPVKANEWVNADASDCTAGHACLQSASVILVDGWSASDDHQAKSRVRSLVPLSALQSLGDSVAKVGHIPMFKELKDLKGAFGYVNMNALPEYARP